jgi:hypothetical protein
MHDVPDLGIIAAKKSLIRFGLSFDMTRGAVI